MGNCISDDSYNYKKIIVPIDYDMENIDEQFKNRINLNINTSSFDRSNCTSPPSPSFISFYILNKNKFKRKNN